jgi:hypothetical protein
MDLVSQPSLFVRTVRLVALVAASVAVFLAGLSIAVLATAD